MNDKHSSEKSSDTKQASSGLDRRSLLTGGAVGLGLGGLLGVGGALGFRAVGDQTVRGAAASATAVGTEPSLGIGGEMPGFGGESLPCHGTHQAGIVTPRAAHVRYLSYQLLPGVGLDALQRMFRVITDDIEGLTSGEGPLADPEPELAARPARLTITVGVGPELVTRVNESKRPEWLAPLPAFSRDQLGNGFDGGDLLFILQSDDSLPISHATRMIERDLTSFATLLWMQQGFQQARGAEVDGRTPRNLMGQVDGTVNPSPEDEDFSDLVWLDETSGWLQHGSALVIRRIRMELDTWDQVDRPARELAVGRTLSTGAPLTGGDEKTPADFEARNEIGLPVIPTTAHIRRARSVDPSERIYRHATNYDDGGEAGLVFTCYQKNPLKQFVPIQQRLDEVDMLNTWVTHVGSAVFAILPGFLPGENLAQGLFSS